MMIDAGMNTARYNAGARMLHWGIAALIVFNLASGLLHDPLEGVVALMPVHKAVGITVLVLSVMRIAWRLAWTAPAYSASLGAVEIAAARAMHVALYVLMIALPVSGWVIASAGKFPITWFGLFEWPKLAVTKGTAVYGGAHEFHEIGGWLLLVLALGHAAAALRHHFVLKDGTLRRMW